MCYRLCVYRVCVYVSLLVLSLSRRPEKEKKCIPFHNRRAVVPEPNFTHGLNLFEEPTTGARPISGVPGTGGGRPPRKSQNCLTKQKKKQEREARGGQESSQS